MDCKESFRFIEDFPDYLIGDCVTVYSTIKRKPLIQSNNNGYKTVTLIGNDGQTQVLVHSLMA